MRSYTIKRLKSIPQHKRKLTIVSCSLPKDGDGFPIEKTRLTHSKGVGWLTQRGCLKTILIWLFQPKPSLPLGINGYL